MRAVHRRSRCMLAPTPTRRRAQCHFHFATQGAMPLNRQHQHRVFVISPRKQSALDQLEDVIGQRLLVIILKRPVRRQRSVPAPRNFLGLRAAHHIRHIRSAVALTGAHHCAQ